MKCRTWLRTCLAVVVIGAGAGGAHADTAPFRERLSDKVVTQASLTSDVKAEIRFGRAVAARILARYPPYNDPKLTRYVNLVGGGLAALSGRPELHYHFAILNTDDINAYSTPGGYVFVTLGALKLMHDESELAGVLGHEIGHVTLKQIVREMNNHGNAPSPEAGLAPFCGGAADPARIAFSQAVGKAMDILCRDGLSRQDEYAADRVGTTLLAEAGYDPTALERYLARVKEVKGEPTRIIHRTHPPFAARIARLQQLIAKEGMTGLHYPRVAARFDSYMTTVK